MTERVPLAQFQANPDKESKPVEHAPLPETVATFDGVPIDLARHFGMDVRNIEEGTKRYLQDIYHWSMESVNEKTIGNALEYVRNIRLQLGESTHGEPQFIKIWNWLSIQRKIRDLQKQQRSMT